jgi:hypothetical protein
MMVLRLRLAVIRHREMDQFIRECFPMVQDGRIGQRFTTRHEVVVHMWNVGAKRIEMRNDRSRLCDVIRHGGLSHHRLASLRQVAHPACLVTTRMAAQVGDEIFGGALDETRFKRSAIVLPIDVIDAAVDA